METLKRAKLEGTVVKALAKIEGLEAKHNTHRIAYWEISRQDTWESTTITIQINFGEVVFKARSSMGNRGVSHHEHGVEKFEGMTVEQTATVLNMLIETTFKLV